MNSKELNELTRNDWRDLGFYYDFDKDKNEWVLIGSKIGLSKFCILLDNYASKNKNNEIYEHDHYGPYMYLKIMTFNEALITKSFIGGTLEDLKMLSELIKHYLSLANINEQFHIDKEYSCKNEASLCFYIREGDFDPASCDPQIN